MILEPEAQVDEILIRIREMDAAEPVAGQTLVVEKVDAAQLPDRIRTRLPERTVVLDAEPEAISEQVARDTART